MFFINTSRIHEVARVLVAQLVRQGQKAATVSQELQEDQVQPVPLANPAAMERLVLLVREEDPEDLDKTPSTASAHANRRRRLLLSKPELDHTRHDFQSNTCVLSVLLSFCFC